MTLGCANYPSNFTSICVIVVAPIYPPVTGQRQTLTYWTIRTLFIGLTNFMIGGIRTCLGVSDDPVFLWISLNSCRLNLLLVRSHQAEIIIVKRLFQGRNSMTRVRVEPRSFDQDRHKNDAFTLLATLLTINNVLRSDYIRQFLSAC